ncbi:hypothetical protein F9278_16535 [Streptomyces phaeolivaceus]|uniref:Uncharacterized protein n=1 Tax=Streptomyces phaeolivaceus TaxID=2653200 RepID=A0A5P8K4K0_9ACTN|nr:hypothetical protein [Streptomyces phaeolivaceus]QFQ97557.1 hypothetical protein F9278_16535 [Streptomyces phaeolivaceus]
MRRKLSVVAATGLAAVVVGLTAAPASADYRYFNTLDECVSYVTAASDDGVCRQIPVKNADGKVIGYVWQGVYTPN